MKENLPDMLNPKEILGVSFKIYKRILLPSAVGLLILYFVFMGLFYFLFPLVFKMTLEQFSDLMKDTEALQNFINTQSFYVNMLLFSLLVNCVIAPMSAGIYQSCKLAFEENPVPMKTVFSFYNSSFTGRIIGFTIFFLMLEVILFILLNWVGLSSLSFSFSVMLRVLTIFSIPMIIFENVSILTAFGNSIRSVAPNMLFIFLLLILAGVVVISGLLLFGIGVVLTFPFGYAVVFALYFSVRGVKGGNMAV